MNARHARRFDFILLSLQPKTGKPTIKGLCPPPPFPTTMSRSLLGNSMPKSPAASDLPCTGRIPPATRRRCPRGSDSKVNPTRDGTRRRPESGRFRNLPGAIWPPREERHIPTGSFPCLELPIILTALNDASVTTNPVKITERRGDFFAYFNRGILSTQSLVHQIPAGPGGAPNYQKLMGRIDQHVIS